MTTMAMMMPIRTIIMNDARLHLRSPTCICVQCVPLTDRASFIVHTLSAHPRARRLRGFWAFRAALTACLDQPHSVLARRWCGLLGHGHERASSRLGRRRRGVAALAPGRTVSNVLLLSLLLLLLLLL